jgi:hypothetical protein
MTKEEIKNWIKANVFYVNIIHYKTGEMYIVSDWVKPENIKIVKELSKEMEEIQIDEKQFRLHKRYYKTINNNFTFKKQ